MNNWLNRSHPILLRFLAIIGAAVCGLIVAFTIYVVVLAATT